METTTYTIHLMFLKMKMENYITITTTTTMEMQEVQEVPELLAEREVQEVPAQQEEMEKPSISIQVHFIPQMEVESTSTITTRKLEDLEAPMMVLEEMEELIITTTTQEVLEMLVKQELENT